jgi:hypothetical protein
MKRSVLAVMLAALLLATVGVTPAWTQDGATAATDEPRRYRYRYGMAEGARPAALSDEPEAVDFRIVEEPEFADARVSSLIEYHGVYPMSPGELAAAITAYGDYPRISRRVVESEVWTPREPLPYEPVGSVIAHEEALMRTSFKFLFFGREYDYVLSSMTEELDDGALLVRSRMIESIDGGLGAIHYSWYLEPVSIREGRTETYLRYFTRVDFAKRPNGLKLALDLFARSDVERLLESVYRYARTGR